MDVDPAELERARQDPRRRVGRYLLLGELGRGGMGVVHRAFDPETHRVVAIKVLLGDEPKAAARFEREAQAVARLNHPGIVQIFEVGRWAGRPFAVQELCAGTSPEGRAELLSVDAALGLVAQACDAIAHAHAQGILHRDLKPANLLVEPDGRVRVLDFGIARLDDRSRLTQSNDVIGTPAYLPPEQAEGKADVRSDVYGLGATLFALLTGQPPFSGETMANVLSAVMMKPAPRPSSLRQEVPAAVDALVLRCLEKEPAARFESATALAAAIAAARAAPAPGPSPRRSPVGIVALVGLAFAGGLAGAVLRSAPAGPPPDVAPTSSTVVVAGPPASVPVPPVEPETEIAVPSSAGVVVPSSAGVAAVETEDPEVTAGHEVLIGTVPGVARVFGRRVATRTPTTKFSFGRTGGWLPARRLLVITSFMGLVGVSTLSVDEGSPWTVQKTPGRRPPHRIEGVSAVDPARERVVVVGGFTEDRKAYVTDLWELQLGQPDAQWEEKTPPSLGPRAMSGIAWDASRRCVLVYGGVTQGARRLGDLCAWDGVDWKTLEVAPELAVPRIRAALVVDGAGQPALFGGSGVGRSASVSPRDLADEPGPFATGRNSVAAAWTSVGYLLIGGANAAMDDESYGDAWLLVARKWLRIERARTWPAINRSPALVSMSPSEVAMFGGSGDAHDETWLLRLEAW